MNSPETGGLSFSVLLALAVTFGATFLAAVFAIGKTRFALHPQKVVV
jgi:hypothetical protein